MKNLTFLYVILIANIVFAEVPVDIKSFCSSNSLNCNQELEPLARDKAADFAKDNFELMSNRAVENQTAACQSRIQESNTKCNPSVFRELTLEIEEVKKMIEAKSTELAYSQRSSEAAASSPDSIKSLIEKLDVLALTIQTLKDVKLARLNDNLDKLNRTCEAEYDFVKQICQAPQAQSNGETTVIIQQKFSGTQSSVTKMEVPKGVAQIGDAQAVANVEASGEIPAPQIDSAVQTFDQSYYATTRIAGDTKANFDNTAALADSSIELANNTIDALRNLAPLESRSTSCRDAFECEDTETPAGPDDFRAPPGEGRATPPAQAGTSPVQGKTSPTGNNGAVSGDQLAMDVQNSAYGAPTGNGTNPGAAPAAGNGGGLSGALSSLSSLFGKTGGSNSFGDDSSYGSNSYGGRYGSRGNGGSYNAPTDSFDYSQNNNPNLKINPNARPGAPSAFTGAPGGNPNFAGGQGGGAGGGLSGQGGSGAGLPKDEKPSFLSKLLGKKDFSLFGKSTSSGGGKFKSGSSSSSGSGKLGENQYIDPKTGEIKTKLFDAEKYKPSQAAEERAYLRSTGRSRRVAAYNPGSGDFQWPDEISKNKRKNIFKTVNLVHKTKLPY